jgi:hypothetical protein
MWTDRRIGTYALAEHRHRPPMLPVVRYLDTANRYRSASRMPVLGCPEVGGRRVGCVGMGAPQVVDGPPSQTTGGERILPVMRYLNRVVASLFEADATSGA